MQDLTKEMKAYALKNALEFGKADVSRVLPKLFQHGLKKENIGKVMPLLKEIVDEVNSYDHKKLQGLFNLNSKYVKEHEEKEKDLPELPAVGRKVVLRAAPYPSGALHIGNAKTFILNALYAEKYNGKFLLVMDDTIGSAEKQITPESYKLIEDAFKFLKIKYEKPVIYKSDRLKIYYKYAEELIKKKKAYVCHCSKDRLRENRIKGVECGCRQFPVKIQLLRWKDMFKEEEGDAILRIKTNMMHPNPAFRDRVLFKISDRTHPRVKNKYRVWPTLEMSWAIDDHLLGITHIIRGEDLRIETDMEKYIWDIFKWKHPVTIHTGLVNLKGVGIKISKSKSQAQVKSKEYDGWEDPRTWSIQSLRERGITAEAIREFVKEIGLNKQNISAPIESLYAINRRLIDAKVNRYSFVKDPVGLILTGKPKWKTVGVPVHPDKDKTRILKVDKIFISREDFDKFKGKEIRLLHLYNVLLEEKRPHAKVTSEENKNIPKINWVSEGVPCKVLMPNGVFAEGIAESGIETLKNSEIVQFERFGFVKLNKRGKEFEFRFAHK
jgi:glutamyl-tRNA synthetase